MKMCWRTIFFIFLTVAFMTQTAHAAKPLVLSGSGTRCVLLAYDFDVLEKNFPDLNLPDNALLLLRGDRGACEPMSLSVEQNGKAYPAMGSESIYVWGAFHAVFFDTVFDKFSPYNLTAACGGKKCTLQVGNTELAKLVGGAKKRGKKPWRDPVTEEKIINAHPLQLADLLSGGRDIEYANEALDLVTKGGLPRLRREARSSLAAGNAPRAACLAAIALKWAPSVEPPGAQVVAMFQDWVLSARAFRAMKRPLAAIRAYEEALKIRKDLAVVKELKKIRAEYNVSRKETAALRPGLSEAEIEYGNHGKIPIPRSEHNVVVGGVKANGVFLGDHRDRVIAQCGEPSELLSGVLLYFDHSVCPEAVFISPRNRVYSLRTHRGKVARRVGIGDNLDLVLKRLGQPDKKEPVTDSAGKKVGVRWIYMKMKVAFIDLTGDGRVDTIEVFDYSLLP